MTVQFKAKQPYVFYKLLFFQIIRKVLLNKIKKALISINCIMLRWLDSILDRNVCRHFGLVCPPLQSFWVHRGEVAALYRLFCYNSYNI